MVKVFLEAQGFAVTSNVKFPVRKIVKKASREEFQTHGYEVDLFAARRDQLLLGSVESFLGPKGLSRQAFDGIADTTRRTHFDCAAFQRYGIPERSHRQGVFPIRLPKMGLIRMALFVGKFAGTDEPIIRKHLASLKVDGKLVELFSLREIILGVVKAAQSKTYVDDLVIMTVKRLHALGLLKRES